MSDQQAVIDLQVKMADSLRALKDLEQGLRAVGKTAEEALGGKGKAAVKGFAAELAGLASTNLGKFGSDLRKIALDDSKKFVNSITDAKTVLGEFGNAGKTVLGLTAGFVGGLGAMAAAVVVLGKKGTEVVGFENAFKALSASVHQNSDAILTSMKAGSQGFISNVELMKAANYAILLDLPVTATSMGKLTDAAVKLGRAMGQDATKSVNDLVLALGRSSPLILDNLGLKVNLEAAEKKYAAANHLSAASLTEAQKKLAFYTAAMDVAEKKSKELGDVQLTFGDQLTRLSTSWSNLYAEMAKVVTTNPALIALTGQAADAFARLTEYIIRNKSEVQALVTTGVFVLVDAMGGALKVVEFAAAGWMGLADIWSYLTVGAKDLAAAVLLAYDALRHPLDGGKQAAEDYRKALAANAAELKKSLEDHQAGLNGVVAATTRAKTEQENLRGAIERAASAGPKLGKGITDGLKDVPPKVAEVSKELQKLMDHLFGADLKKQLADYATALHGNLSKLTEAQVVSIENEVTPLVMRALAAGYKVDQTLLDLAGAHNARGLIEAEAKFQQDRKDKERELQNAIAKDTIDTNEALEARKRELQHATTEAYLAEQKRINQEAVAAWQDLGQQLEGILGGSFGKLVGIAGNAWRTIADQFGIEMGKVGLAVAQGLSAALNAVMTGFAAGKQYGRGKGAAVGALSGGLSGAAAGAAIGTMFGGPFGTAIGAGFGAIGGTLLGGIGGFLGGGAKNKAAAAQNAADLAAMRKGLIDTYGSMENLRKAANLLGIDMSKAFSTKSAVDLKAQIEGLHAAEEKYKKTMEGLATAATGWAGAAKAFSDHLKSGFDDLAANAAKGREALGLKVGELGSNLDIANAKFNRLGLEATAIFAGLVRGGVDVVSAFRQMGEGFDALRAAQGEFGLEADAVTAQVLAMYSIIADNPEAADALSNLNQMMVGLADAGIHNQELFSAFGADATDVFNQLTAGGATSNQAMALMQPTLQQLWEAQRDFGYQTDETTQALIDQAKEQGLVGENMRSVNEKILDVLLAIAKVFKADLPDGIHATDQAWQDLNHTASQTPRPPRPGGGDEGDGGGGGQPGDHARGATVIPFRPGGYIARVAEQGTEGIFNMEDVVRLASAAGRAAANDGGGGSPLRGGPMPPIIVKLQVGERELGKVMLSGTRRGTIRVHKGSVRNYSR